MMGHAYPGGSRERFSTSRTTTHGETSSSSTPSSAGTPVVPLGCMVMMAVLCNFDHGVIPAVLSDIQEHFDAIGYIEQSLLGSLVYVGVVSGTFLAGVSTNCMGAKWLLVASLLAASAALYGFSCATSLAVMYTARFFVGFCQVSHSLELLLSLVLFTFKETILFYKDISLLPSSRIYIYMCFLSFFIGFTSCLSPCMGR